MLVAVIIIQDGGVTGGIQRRGMGVLYYTQFAIAILADRIKKIIAA